MTTYRLYFDAQLKRSRDVKADYFTVEGWWAVFWRSAQPPGGLRIGSDQRVGAVSSEHVRLIERVEK